MSGNEPTRHQWSRTFRNSKGKDNNCRQPPRLDAHTNEENKSKGQWMEREREKDRERERENKKRETERERERD
eukprot:5405165-Pyramimonas_sp.AAC.1